MGTGVGASGAAWGLPRGQSPHTKITPLLFHLSQGRNSGEGTPSSSLISVFGKEPQDKREQATSLLRRDACSPSEGTGAGLPGWGEASLASPLRSAHPPSWPQLAEEPRRRGCAPLCSLSGSSHPLGGESRKSWTLVSPHLLKELEGRVGSQGRAEIARRRERGGGVEGPGPRLPPGPKALLLSNSRPSRKSQPPEASAAPGRPQQGSSTAAREVRCASSHRNMGTLKIHAMFPVHYV